MVVKSSLEVNKIAIRNNNYGGTNWGTETATSVDMNDTLQEVRTDAQSKGVYFPSLLENMPIGTILPWLEDLTNTPSLPTGWQLCDGTNNTPNLDSNGRLLRGINGTTGGTGGSSTHTHTWGTSSNRGTSGTATEAQSVDTGSTFPKSYSVKYIMKMS